MVLRNISLIGMSNIGKSHWRKEISPLGFTPFCCDDLIKRNLQLRFGADKFQKAEDVARWMGQPYEPQFSVNQVIYLEEEANVMEEIIRELRKCQGRAVVDTTGSVIYLGEEIMSELRELSVVVLLDMPESLQRDFYRQYLSNPKPVIWGDIYQPFSGENPKDALARCYPLLLKSRNEMYQRYAHVIFTYDELRSPGLNGQKFLKELKKRS